MIFVTVGTHTQGFERLVKGMDEVAARLDEEIVMQIGNTKYEPKNATFFRFETTDRIEELHRKARAIVTHAGAGSIINALNFGKPVIVVPRMKGLGEHIDDHQLELARKLEEEGKITAVYEIEGLDDAISSLGSKKRLKQDRPPMVKAIKDYLDGLSN